MEWTVRPVAVGTLADTPSSLRAKAAEFLRLAAASQNATPRGGKSAVPEERAAKAKSRPARYHGHSQ
jgi:hypothetical protein